jgi:peptidoglycan/xylan/chitin deacetylase (PgdA/CDA1 family)
MPPLVSWAWLSMMVLFQYVNSFPSSLHPSEFDPLPSRVIQPSDSLYAFLRKNQVRATHFFIGMNIIYNPTEFNLAFQTNQDDIAVHTWTHPYMTTLSNNDVVAQLGWTLQLIYNSAGGRLARYWRPPYGDTDLRVTSIAQEVFGLTTVIWNHEYVLYHFVASSTNPASALETGLSVSLEGPTPKQSRLTCNGGFQVPSTFLRCNP